MTSSGAGRVVESSSGSPAISVVVTTIPTSTSQTAYLDPIVSDAAQHPFSQIKLVGVGGLERQNYCCGHWFPSSKSYHRHLAEKAFSDTSHEAKLLDLGMVRCTHCSMWVHSENIVAHVAKSHGNNRQGKTSKVIPVGTIADMSGLSRDSLMSGTNIVIKVAGQNTPRSFSSDNSKTIASSLSSPGTVKLVSTSSSTLYQKLHNINHSGGSGPDKVIVRKAISSTSPVVNVGPRLVMKSVRQGGVMPLGRNHKMIQQVGQSNFSSVTGVNRVPLATAFKGTKESPSVSPAGSKENPLKAVVSQSNFHKISGKNLKLVKRGTPEVPKDKSLTASSLNNSQLSVSTKNKDKNKAFCVGDSSSRKIQQNKKSRKQVLKPSASEVCYTDTNTSPAPNPSPFTERGVKTRGKKTKVISQDESSYSNPPPNHKGQRRKSKESLESYTPKMSKRPGRGLRGGWNKKKRGPGRPKKSQLDETPDTSEIDSLFDEMDKEDLENEPVVVAKKEEENIPTVELDLFTLPSTNEQVSVLLTEPQNPNFKVYASMDAIFVGDSALGDVTNQIGYVTDANNVVYVNPSHFLFPNVEDLENFVPSPILTMKGSKVGLTPARKTWNVNSNKAYAPIILKHTSVNSSRDAVSSDASSEKTSHEEKESLIPIPPPAKSRVDDHVQKNTQSNKTVLVTQDRKSPKKMPNPVQASSSLEPEATEVIKNSHNSTVKAVGTIASVSKEKIDKKKKRQKSITEASPENGVQNNSMNTDANCLQVESTSEIIPDQVPPKITPDVKNKKSGEVIDKVHTTAIDSLIQKCVVKIEELKYPLKFEKSTSLSPEVVCDDDKVKTKGDTTSEMLQNVSPAKTVKESAPFVEVPANFSDLQSGRADITNLGIPEEYEKLSPSVEKRCMSQAEDTVTDAVENKPLETVKVTLEVYPSTCVTEENKVICRTVGGGPPRRMRRRRLRTKSANIVSSITDNMQEFSIGGHDRRVRHVSENSSLSKIEVTGHKTVLVNSQNQRTESGHSPKRKCEKKVNVSADVENHVDSSIPKQSSNSPQNSTQFSSTSPEKISSDTTGTVPDISPSSVGKGVKKHKSKHDGKTKITKMESLCTEMSKPLDVSDGSFNEQPSEESNHEEKPAQVRSVRERRPSFKLLESFSIASQSPKRLPQTKPEQPLSPSDHSIDKVGSTQQTQNGSPVVTDLSPSREWLGRGAKLKAQVLIQDQQAGVMDSHIYPSNDSLRSSTEPVSPKLGSHTPPKTPTLTSKMPSPSGNSKAFRSPTTIQNREWQARGAKLKAQVMISDPESSLVPYIDSDELSKPLASPPAKRIKLDTSPTYTKDICFDVKQQKSQIPVETSSKPSPVSSQSPEPPHTTEIVKDEKNTTDMRSYIKPVSPITQAKEEQDESPKETRESECLSPKKLTSHSPPTENSPESLSMNDSKSVEPIPVSDHTFEGFMRLTRRSALRSKALRRLVSLLETKRWYHLDKFPFPVDQLCYWDDELLSTLSDYY